MRKLDKQLENKRIVLEKLLEYGFIEKDGQFIYEHNLYNQQFQMLVIVKYDKMTSQVIDLETNEDYLLVDLAGVQGDFVGKVKKEYEEVLEDIIQKCVVMDVFKSDYAKKIMKYVENKYGDKLEYLWKNSPQNAVFRHHDNKKWYGAILTVSKRKLGFEDDTLVEIIDLKNIPDEVQRLVDHQKIFPGYHMNKKHWYTIILDGTLELEEIYKLMDISYNIKK